ncbi:MAG TPA: CinA family protein [Oscillospiraceae bacterium]|nr:CinA family protein [Oscillospiraceae bacterium]
MNDNTLTKYAKEVIELLSFHNLSLSVAESCTGGLLSKILTDISGISAVYKGGICVYSNESKINLLGVSAKTIETHGAVSEKTAYEMALFVCRKFNTDAGIAITGIAGPLSDNTKKPVGLIYIATNIHDDVNVIKLSNTFEKDVRNSNRYEAALRSLQMLSERLHSLKGK